MTDLSQTLLQWHCPDCNFCNLDDIEVTSLPMCERCGQDFDWNTLFDHMGESVLTDEEFKAKKEREA